MNKLPNNNNNKLNFCQDTFESILYFIHSFKLLKKNNSSVLINLSYCLEKHIVSYLNRIF